MSPPRPPIAITAADCVLPGAHDVAAFRELVLRGGSAVGEPTEGRFGVPNAAVLGAGRDRAHSLAGGYVSDFVPQLDGLEVPDLAGLDPLVHWLLHCSRRALAAAGRPGDIRTGAVFGNLSFPTDGMARWAEGLASGTPPGDPRNHFMSGLPAAIVGKALGLEAGTTCVDAACASSLYAIKLACDALAAGRADRMLAGAVQRADSLFLHIGFAQLGALSATGQSRPFHRGADGLVPAEGCVVLVLRRLEDAVAGNEPILGVIRGVGLSNDGRGRSLLAPSSEGQVRSMRSALAEAAWLPDSVQFVECHATGTPTGDRTELESLAAVYPGGPVGSLKGNLGHLITVAGAAGLLKMLVAMEAGQLPPSPHADAPLPELGRFNLIPTPAPWPTAADGHRRAAVSAFGFGGNNAHLLVESYQPGQPVAGHRPLPRAPLAVRALVDRRGGDDVVLPLEGLRFPPADLQAALAQQTLLLQTGREAWAQAALAPPRDRLGLYVGMACDGRITRWGTRWRRLHLGRATAEALDEVAPPLRAEHVVGTMPNIVANRLGVQLDAAGPSFTLSQEELSGLRALDAAWDALSSNEIDVAIVAAVDLPSDARAMAARHRLGRRDAVEDAAVVLVLQRAADAPAGPVLGHLADDVEGVVVRTHPPRHGAADALVAVADALRRGGDCVVQVSSLGGERASVGVRAGQRSSKLLSVAPTGPVLRIPLHPSEPAWPTSESPMFPSSRRLPRPPALVPVASSAARPAAGPPSAALEPTAAVYEDASAGWAPGFAAWRRAIGGAHSRFLEDQASLHAAFLAHHSQTSALLLHLAAQQPSEGVPPVQTRAPAPPPPSAAPSPRPAPAPPAPLVRPAAAVPTPQPAHPKVAAPPDSATSSLQELPGPRLSRAELEMGANGSITTIFGPKFADHDAWTRVVRMPEPPLLLADRVLGIEGPMGVLGKGRIVTETDVRDDSWYLHDGRMPGGLMIESGQADLLLGSWQGIDRLNQSERIYRLLGCTLTYRGELPRPGDTLQYDIRIDQHAKLGGIRMFFFRYDCHVGGQARLNVKDGQAGFFTDEELGNSGGCIWDAETHDPGTGQVDAPVATAERRQLDRAGLEAFARGDLVTAFGPEFRRANTHTWTPRTPGDRMLILDRAEFDLAGGPWKRGYLRAELDIRPDLWFFHGHFHNDPCMPGTLMFDGCLQAMYLLLAAGGHTLERDGWRFEPLKDMPFKLRCRGQVTPTSSKLVYEVFVTEVVGGPVPRLVAQVLCTVDGLKCFHADPMGVELVPDWPLTRPQFAHWKTATVPAGPSPAYAWPSLLACAWGRPTDAFGQMYADFDGPRKVPRLPGPPYHFISRVQSTEGKQGGQAAGCAATMAYDVPPDAWYFAEGTSGTMPWAVLLEAALQPCGWLASWAGCAVGPDDFLFRNLDGTTTVHREVRPDSGTLVTVTKLERVSRSAGMILVTFTVSARDTHGDVLDMKTTFGFFPPAAFVDQVGVGSTPQERERLAAPMEPVAIADGSEGLGGPVGRLRLLDRAGRVDAEWYRGEMEVRSDDWFFKAHFYRDPVQPGSLGIEALIRLLQVVMHDRGMAADFRRPRFEAVASGEPMTWKYRGQVVPENRLVQSEVRILESRRDDRGMLAVAEGHLWVDGKKIYTMPRFAMRVVEGESCGEVTLPVPVDHRPTWTAPATAMMTLAMHAFAQTGASALVDGVALRWLTFPEGKPRAVAVSVTSADGGTQVVLGPTDRPHFRATTSTDLSTPTLPNLENSAPDDTTGESLYASGSLFHGPSFHALERFTARGSNGASALLRANLAPDVLLDGMTHLVPHDDMGRWFDVPEGKAAYPARLRRVVLAGALPTGIARVEARAVEIDRGRPVIGLWLYADDTSDTCVAYVLLEEVLLPKGPIGLLAPELRRAFLQGSPVEGAGLSTRAGDTWEVSAGTVRGSDWLTGTVASLYRTEDPAEIAVRDAAVSQLGGHPRDVRLMGLRAARLERPLTTVELLPDATDLPPGTARVRVGPTRPVDLDGVNRWWRTHLGQGAWAGEAVFAALAQRSLADFRVVDPAAIEAIDGPILFLANHENYLESVLFTTVASAVFNRPLRALAKVEHQTRWLGRLHAAMTSYPGRRDPPRIVWFDQNQPASLRPVLDAAPRGASLLVHVEGTRQTTSGAPIGKVSSVWADLAIERGWPVVPVAFRGGLAGERTDLPVSAQTHIIGSPISAATLAALPYAERRSRIAAAIDALGADVPPASGPPVVAEAGRVLRECIEASGALTGADPAWAARLLSLG